MSDSNQKITHLLVDQIPDYVQEFFPLFVTFVTKYFTWLETAGDQNSTSVGTQYSLQNLQLNRDIDTTAQSLQKEFLHSFVPNLPDTLATDPTIFIKLRADDKFPIHSSGYHNDFFYISHLEYEIIIYLGQKRKNC
jgi:hypothetical protein